MNCTRLEELINDFVDGQLPEDQRHDVEQHLAGCPDCRRSVEQLRAIVALGNPGPAYAVTRHNAGFVLGDFLAKEWQFPKFRRVGKATVTDDIVRGEPVAIVKPRTYMNLSGGALGPLRALSGFDMSHDMLVVVDDYAIPIGTFRMRARGSAGGHNGLRSIEDALNFIIFFSHLSRNTCN